MYSSILELFQNRMIMKKTEAFFEMHRDIEVLRRRAIAEYWNDNQTDDVIAQLSLRQLSHLVTIEKLEPCSLLTVMRHTGLSKSAVSAAVDKLVRLGILSRVSNPDNRREILIGVLPAVKTHLKNIDARFRRLVNSIFAEECTGEEIDKIAEVSALIVEKLRKYDLK